MPLFIIRRLVLLLLVAALAPMQALASEAKASDAKVLGFSSDLVAFSQLFESESSPASDIPAGTSFVQHNTLAIVQNQRSIFAPKQEADGNEATHNPSIPNAFVGNDDAYAFIAKWQASRAAFHHDKSAYRLGGWKDSNALYVALNGQFSS
ncbi:hypothetical protein [Vibrio breoganii]|uniref:hypothetical protein n=1 Tax=Vibrio breoganii TaxID=553239 RepID=UPI0002EF0A29|nr:hypothetical protein [Vibrio breoganii]OED83957.1 hypothetical protein A1QE_13445 [Vibrio breoganii ZF-55]